MARGERIVSDAFFQAALFFTNFGFLGPFIIFGIYCIDRRIFINVLIMGILSAFINAYLKSIWQIPLDPSLNKVGWAFPSGHTQFSLVVWLVLIYQIRKLWIALIATIISISSYFGMVYFHYHNWYDISGGIFFGVLVFLIFVAWDYFFKKKQFELEVLSMVLSVIILIALPPQSHHYTWLFIYLGMSTGVLGYLVLERLGYIQIVSKLDRRRSVEFLMMIVFMFAVKSVNTDPLVLIYLKGFVLTAVSLLAVSRLDVRTLAT